MPELTSLNLVHLHPLYGTALFVFSSNLLFYAIDNLFGGDGRFPIKVEEREFTLTEQRVDQTPAKTSAGRLWRCLERYLQD